MIWESKQIGGYFGYFQWLESGTEEGRRAYGGTAAHHGGRWLGQDEGPDLPHREPSGTGRRTVQHPGHHVHQQGRDGDARARRPHDRRCGQGCLAQHVPLVLRALPAPRDRGDGHLQAQLRHLRRIRQPDGHQGMPQGDEPRRQAVHARERAECHLERQEPAHGAEGHGARCRQLPPEEDRGGLPPLCQQAAQQQCARLRRPADDLRRAARGE